MKRLPTLKKQRIRQILLIIPLACLIFLNSCNQKSNSSESELLQKINAVHQQIMIQGNISKKEQQALLSLASLVATDEDFTSSKDMENAIPFDDVETIPTFSGCESFSGKDLKRCFKEKIHQIFKDQFNPNIAKELGITEQKNVEVFFRVTKNGNISNLKVRDANVVVQAEIVRILKQLPVMKPGSQNGETVDVMCAMKIPYGG